LRKLEGDAAGAVRALSVALRKQKGLAPAHESMASILVEVGKIDEAIDHYRTALSIDPTLAPVRFELARALGLVGQWEEADQLLDIPVVEPGQKLGQFLYRSRLALWRRKVPGDFAEMPILGPEMGILQQPRAMAAILKRGELTDDDRQYLETAAARGEANSRRRALFFQLNSEVYAFMFEIDHALAAIKEAIASGLLDITWADRCPILAPVRSDPRFGPLLDVIRGRADRVVAAWASG
jgi:eukaryotic-like serine/threonine-protein kinase